MDFSKKAIDFNIVHNVLQLPELKSDNVNTLATVIHTANEEKGPTTLSFKTLSERMEELRKVNFNKVLPQRGGLKLWLLHIATFGISYIYLNNYDNTRAVNILKEKDALFAKYHDQYFKQLFAAIEEDPANMKYIEEMLNKPIKYNDIVKILKFALKTNNKKLVKQCREIMRSMQLSEGTQWEWGTMFQGDLSHVNLDKMKNRIAEGDDVDLKIGDNSCTYKSALFRAARENRRDIVGILIDAGADVDAGGKIRHYYDPEISPLLLVIRNNNQDIAVDLIKAGAKYDEETIVEAASRGQLDVVSACLEQAEGVAPAIRTRAFMEAISHHQEETALRFIESGVDINAKVPGTGYSALMSAIGNRLPQVALRLIEKGADVNALASDGKSASWLASEQNQLVVLEAIAQHKVSDELQVDGLMVALEKNHINLYPMLMQALGTHTINHTNAAGNTPLMVAAIAGRVPIIESLLSSKEGLELNLNAINNEGYTALMLAIKHNRVDIALKLIKAGARCDIVAPSGETALSLVPPQHSLLLQAIDAVLGLSGAPSHHIPKPSAPPQQPPHYQEPPPSYAG